MRLVKQRNLGVLLSETPIRKQIIVDIYGEVNISKAAHLNSHYLFPFSIG